MQSKLEVNSGEEDSFIRKWVVYLPAGVVVCENHLIRKQQEKDDFQNFYKT